MAIVHLPLKRDKEVGLQSSLSLKNISSTKILSLFSCSLSQSYREKIEMSTHIPDGLMFPIKLRLERLRVDVGRRYLKFLSKIVFGGWGTFLSPATDFWVSSDVQQLPGNEAMTDNSDLDGVRGLASELPLGGWDFARPQKNLEEGKWHEPGRKSPWDSEVEQKKGVRATLFLELPFLDLPPQVVASLWNSPELEGKRCE